MSWLGDVVGFEGFNLKNIGKKIAKNPEQLLLGAGDPLTAGVWNSALGTDYEPLVNEWGGATDDTYQKAEAAGINTGAGKSMHGVAQGIAGLFAGNYGAGKLGTLFGNSGASVGASGNAGFGDYTNPNWFNKANQSIPMGTGGGGWQSSLQNGLGSLKEGFGTFNEYAKPVSQGLGYAQQAQGIWGGGQQQAPAPQMAMGGGQSVSAPINGILDAQAQLEQQRQDAIRKRAAGILGNTYG